jgi:hypothetical protein
MVRSDRTYCDAYRVTELREASVRRKASPALCSIYAPISAPAVLTRQPSRLAIQHRSACPTSVIRPFTGQPIVRSPSSTGPRLPLQLLLDLLAHAKHPLNKNRHLPPYLPPDSQLFPVKARPPRPATPETEDTAPLKATWAALIELRSDARLTSNGTLRRQVSPLKEFPLRSHWVATGR